MSRKNEYGRFHLVINTEAGTASLLMENVNRTDEHWLTLTKRHESHSPVGYLRLRPVSPGSHVFEVAEVRPATGPLGASRDREGGGVMDEQRIPDEIVREEIDQPEDVAS